MNVKQGDLAIVVKSMAGNEGRIVTVGQFLGDYPVFLDMIWEGKSCWVVSCASGIRDMHGNTYTQLACRDAWLRPVSGIPDETIIDEKLKEPA